MASFPVILGPGLTASPAVREAEARFVSSLPEASAATLDDVRKIVLAFYDPKIGSDLRRCLDRWLDAYQTRMEAWTMADRFLQEDMTNPAQLARDQTEQLMLFAAITMHHKIRYDFLDLPAGSHESLRNTLLTHISRLNQQAAAGGSKAVLKRLCLAFSCLVVQSNGISGEDAISTIIKIIPFESSAIALLEILTTLAEEARNKRTPISDRRREDFLGGLRKSAGSVLGLLERILAIGATSGHVAVLERVFQCFGAWIAACDLPPAQVGSSTAGPLVYSCNGGCIELCFDTVVCVSMYMCLQVAGCPLLNHVFSAILQHPALFSVACDTIHELLHAYRE